MRESNEFLIYYTHRTVVYKRLQSLQKNIAFDEATIVCLESYVKL